MSTKFQSLDGRPAIRMERRLAHAPQKVWRALTESNHLNQWFPFDVEMDLRAGGKVQFMEKGGQEAALEGVIVEIDYPRLLAYQWGDDLLRWELLAEGTGCRLIFTHIFDDRAGAASFAAGWQFCLDAMAQMLDGETIHAADFVGPDWSRQMAELHERNIVAFALHKGSVSQSEQGWQVRFERQLTQPIDTVWAMLLADATAPQVGDPPPLAATTPEVTPGAITEIAAPNTLVYDWLHNGRVAGSVRWSLGPGTGHGVRLLLTQGGPADLSAQQTVALDAWEHRIERMAKQALDAHATVQGASS